MAIQPDIDIARSRPPAPIADIADQLGIAPQYVEQYGRYKAKIDPMALEEGGKEGKLVLVTAITPTSAGEGKTTTTVGLADALRRLGKRAVAALREPSLGPVFGIKGGAAGGGYAQVIPMEDINLHFTGDFHAVGAANNLLAAMLDNHIYQGNELGIDPKRITWRRCVDMNDRQLRSIVGGLGGRSDGRVREDGFDITVASEVMAAFCLADGVSGLKARLGRMIVGYTRDERPVTAADLRAEGAMAALLKDALKPNLVQTLEHTPAFVHGGPFANIAHGCNSALATKMALRFGDYAVTEAGFGADLGAEKFFDIKCRLLGLEPSAVVIVATARALKMHGGVAKVDLAAEDPAAVARGMPNLLRHLENITGVFGLPAVVAVNRFPGDADSELEAVAEGCRRAGADVALSEVFSRGGEGGLELAQKVAELCERPQKLRFCYGDEMPIAEKIGEIARRVYRAGGVDFAPAALKQMARIEDMGFGRLPVCMAKTQYSFSDDPSLTGAPEGFRISVRGVRVSAGAGFVVALTGDIMTMPGLPRRPAAENIDVDENGEIRGLF
jgi:formate--tetrahydrofolate ligase